MRSKPLCFPENAEGFVVIPWFTVTGAPEYALSRPVAVGGTKRARPAGYT